MANQMKTQTITKIIKTKAEQSYTFVARVQVGMSRHFGWSSDEKSIHIQKILGENDRLTNHRTDRKEANEIWKQSTSFTSWDMVF